MKKLMISLLSVSMAVLMAGCVGQSSGGDEATSSLGTAAPTPADTINETTGSNAIISPGESTGSLTPSEIEDPIMDVEPSNDSPAAALEGGLKAYKTMDAAEFDKYFEKGIAGAMATEEEPDQASLNHFKIVFENLSWTIRTETMHDNEGFVEVDILNGDYATAMETVGTQLQQEMGEGADNDAYIQKMNELIKTAMTENMPEEPMNTLVFMVKTDDGWMISEDNMPLFIAVRGGANFVSEAETPGPEESVGGGADTGEETTSPSQPAE